jgi:hypothetical protein
VCPYLHDFSGGKWPQNIVGQGISVPLPTAECYCGTISVGRKWPQNFSAFGKKYLMHDFSGGKIA